MPNAQEWLDQNYPKERRHLIYILNINRKNLIGSLDLTDFTNLETLDCFFNQLTSLELTGLIKLELIACNDNLLTNLDFLSNLNPEKLTILDIKDNNISDQDISIFSRFINLESLSIGNLNSELTSGIYNRFYGSLINFKDLKRLKRMVISNTDINSGVEYLPKSLMSIGCSCTKKESEVEKISKELKSFFIDNLIEKLKVLSESSLNLNISEEIITNEVYQKLKELEIIEEGFEFNTVKMPKEIFIQALEKSALIPNEQLRNEYLNYGLCQNCYQVNTLLGFCQKCSIEKLEKPIPYQQFTELQEIGRGGFGTIYKAKIKEKNVVLKVLHDKVNKEELLREVANYQMFKEGGIAKIFGITQDPIGNYIIIMMYSDEGDLRNYLHHNYKSIGDKIEHLAVIIIGLNHIHNKGLIHKDLHLGNVLVTKDEYCIITDFGLSSAVYEKKKNEIRGVLPYLAPEILRGEEHSESSDIYSFGMMMYEILTGLEPYHNYDLSEEELIEEIIENNLRPDFNDGFLIPKSPEYLENNFEGFLVPQFLQELIERCWNSDPNKRPSSNIKKIKSIESPNDRDNSYLLFILRNSQRQNHNQIEEAEKFNQLLRSNYNFKINHSFRFSHSQPINSKYFTAREKLEDNFQQLVIENNK